MNIFKATLGKDTVANPNPVDNVASPNVPYHFQENDSHYNDSVENPEEKDANILKPTEKIDNLMESS